MTGRRTSPTRPTRPRGDRQLRCQRELINMDGNVWEWTDSCYARSRLDAAGEVVGRVVNCGIRIAEGRHRAYMADFVRRARRRLRGWYAAEQSWPSPRVQRRSLATPAFPLQVTSVIEDVRCLIFCLPLLHTSAIASVRCRRQIPLLRLFASVQASHHPCSSCAMLAEQGPGTAKPRPRAGPRGGGSRTKQPRPPNYLGESSTRPLSKVRRSP